MESVSRYKMRDSTHVLHKNHLNSQLSTLLLIKVFFQCVNNRLLSAVAVQGAFSHSEMHDAHGGRYFHDDVRHMV